MNLRLRANNGPFPPQGWNFTDARTGRVFDGMEHDQKTLVAAIIVHRSANPKIYPTFERQHTDRFYVLQEVYTQKAAKYPELFEDSDSAPAVEPPPSPIQTTNTVCPQCGSKEANPIYCSSCAGQKLIGYHCAKCGRDRNP